MDPVRIIDIFLLISLLMVTHIYRGIVPHIRIESVLQLNDQTLIVFVQPIHLIRVESVVFSIRQSLIDIMGVLCCDVTQFFSMSCLC